VTRSVRIDPLTGAEVILSTERTRVRPPLPGPVVDPHQCPFCPGHEAQTRSTIAAVPAAGEWSARAFANRRPALVVEEQSSVRRGLFAAHGGVGAHEVIVESRLHAPLHDQPVAQTERALSLAVQRLSDLRRDPRLVSIHWFRNVGAAAGASQEHPHAQVVALPLVPAAQQSRAARAHEHHARTGQGLLAAVLAAEVASGERVVGAFGPVVALCPFAPRAPFEVWLVPQRAMGSLAGSTASEQVGLASALHGVTAALRQVVGPHLCYNATLVDPSVGAPEHVGWFVRVEPRLAVDGGLERGLGVAVHGIAPEAAAHSLRGAVP